MADLEKIVKIIFAGDDSDLARTINSVGSGMDKLALNVGKATQPLADLTDSIMKVNAVLAGLAAGAFVAVISQAGKFGDSFSEISTLIDAPADALGDFQADILEYSRNSTASLESITGATYQIISATGDWESSLELLSAAERLNVAGKGELDSTTKLLATSLNAYGGTAADAADYSDILFTTVKVGVTNLTELSASLGTVTGLAASAGVPFEDLSASVGALTGTVGNTSLAVTQIKAVLTAIVKPSAGAAEAAKELGIAFDSETLAAMGLEKFLKMVYEATDGNSAVMAKLFGSVEGLNGALVLGADTSGKYAAALQGMESRAGATDAAHSKMVDNFKENNQGLINNLQATLIEAGLPLLDEWGAIVNSLSSIFKGISIGFDQGSFDPLIKYIEDVGSAIATEFEGIAKALPEALAGIDWDEFTESLDGLVDAGKNLFKELFGDLDLTKPKDLEKALQKTIDTFENWIHLTSGIVSGLAPFLGFLADLAGKFSELDGDTAKTAGSFLGWGKSINVVAGLIPLLTAPLSLFSGALGLMSLVKIPGAISAMGKMIPKMGLLTGSLGMLTKGAAAFGLGWTIGTTLRNNIPIVKEFGDWIGEAFYNLVNLGESSGEAMAKQAAHTAELAKAALELVKVKEAGKALADQEMVAKVELDLTEFFGELDGLEKEIEDKERAAAIGLKVDADLTDFFADIDTAEKQLEDDALSVAINADLANFFDDIDEAEKKIDEELPTEKLIEIKLQGDIDIELQRIKSTAETLQTSFEWNAKIEIASVEADAKRVEAIASSISTAWESTGDVISAAFSILADPGLSLGDYMTIVRLIEAESSRRAELLVMQKKLTEAEIAHIKARTKAIASGQGVITISADGVEPELELVLQKIIKLAQIQANEEGFGMLLGI